MSKPPLLYASPFPPLQSGISEYSRYLAGGLREHFDVTLLTEGQEIADAQLRDGCRVRSYRGDEIDVLREYPYRIYNIGNNPWFHGYIYECCLKWPGLVILHDAVIYFLVVGYYMDRPDFLKTVYRLEGARGVALIKDQLKSGEHLLRYAEPQLLPFLDELLGSGNRILVHSEYALQLLRRRGFACARLGRIDMPIPSDGPRDDAGTRKIRESLGLPTDAVLICSYGFVAPTKLNHMVCEAVERVRAQTRAEIYYCMVGEGTYVDDWLCDHIRVTGYAPESDYENYLRCADLVVNIRYPSMGETSIALLRAMSLGKPCIVTNHAWFSELPDSVVLKTDIPTHGDVVGQLTRAFRQFVDDRSAFERMAQTAAEHVARHHAVPTVAGQIAHLVLADATLDSRE
jgi:glycosyltransferase involved in cell wall biosynthesis